MMFNVLHFLYKPTSNNYIINSYIIIYYHYIILDILIILYILLTLNVRVGKFQTKKDLNEMSWFSKLKGENKNILIFLLSFYQKLLTFNVYYSQLIKNLSCKSRHLLCTLYIVYTPLFCNLEFKLTLYNNKVD